MNFFWVSSRRLLSSWRVWNLLVFVSCGGLEVSPDRFSLETTLMVSRFQDGGQTHIHTSTHPTVVLQRFLWRSTLTGASVLPVSERLWLDVLFVCPRPLIHWLKCLLYCDTFFVLMWDFIQCLFSGLVGRAAASSGRLSVRFTPGPRARVVVVWPWMMAASIKATNIRKIEFVNSKDTFGAKLLADANF